MSRKKRGLTWDEIRVGGWPSSMQDLAVLALEEPGSSFTTYVGAGMFTTGIESGWMELLSYKTAYRTGLGYRHQMLQMVEWNQRDAVQPDGADRTGNKGNRWQKKRKNWQMVWQKAKKWLVPVGKLPRDKMVGEAQKNGSVNDRATA